MFPAIIKWERSLARLALEGWRGRWLGWRAAGLLSNLKFRLELQPKLQLVDFNFNFNFNVEGLRDSTRAR